MTDTSDQIREQEYPAQIPLFLPVPELPEKAPKIPKEEKSEDEGGVIIIDLQVKSVTL